MDRLIINEVELSEQDLGQLYKTSDVLLIASKSEGFGIPILEAQLYGTPVITNDFLAMKDYTFYGISVPPLMKYPNILQNGLWSLPELALEQQVVNAVKQNLQLTVTEQQDLPVFRHTFSHFHLDITPCEILVESSAAKMATTISEQDNYQWCADLSQIALAAPVTAIMRQQNKPAKNKSIIHPK